MDAGEYVYCGRIELVDKPQTETQPGEDGVPRKVWMFSICSVPDNDVKKSAMFVFKDMEEFKARGKDENGDLVINKEQAEVVKLIFDLYLGGKSILGIVKELKERSIKSPTGKENWPKRSIEEMLSNEKYIGVSVVNVGGKEGQIYKLNDSHPGIISKEMFDAVQEEKHKRSNVIVDENGTHRSSKKYSSKK